MVLDSCSVYAKTNQAKERFLVQGGSHFEHFEIGHLHDDVILLLRPESFRGLLIQTSLGLPNLRVKGKTKRILVVVVECHHRANSLFQSQNLTDRS